MSSALSDPQAVTGSSLGSGADRPLNDQEYQLLQRMLSDPFSFPLVYKTWLVSYLETSDMNLPITAINGLSALLGITGAGGGTLGILPAGLMMPYAGLIAPVGSKLCDGTAYDPTVESRLFAAIGYAYGGVTPGPFNVPDLRGRVTVGKGSHSDVDTLGKSDGLGVGTRTPIHNSQVNDPGHGHGASGGDNGHNHGVISPGPPGTQWGGGSGWGQQSATSTIGIASIYVNVSGAGTGISVGPGGSRPVDEVPFEVVNFIIIA